MDAEEADGVQERQRGVYGAFLKKLSTEYSITPIEIY